MTQPERAPIDHDLWQMLLEHSGWAEHLTQRLSHLSSEDLWLLHQELFDLWWLTNDELQRRRSQDGTAQRTV